MKFSYFVKKGVKKLITSRKTLRHQNLSKSCTYLHSLLRRHQTYSVFPLFRCQEFFLIHIKTFKHWNQVDVLFNLFFVVLVFCHDFNITSIPKVDFRVPIHIIASVESKNPDQNQLQPGLHNKQALRAAFEPAEGVATNEVGA